MLFVSVAHDLVATAGMVESYGMTDLVGEGVAQIVLLEIAIEANFPKLVLAAKTQGPLVFRAVEEMAVSGSAVVRSSATLSGKAVAC